MPYFKLRGFYHFSLWFLSLLIVPLSNAHASIVNQQQNLVIGARSVLVIRGVDPSTHTWTDSDADLLKYRDQLDDYIKKSSGNKTWIGTFDITPVYNFTAQQGVFYDPKFRELATAGGYDVNAYNVVVYLHQSTFELGAGALGSGNGDRGSIWGNNNLTWFTPGLIHESFHAFGLGHAVAIEGEQDMFPGEIPGGVDPYHFMGSEGSALLNSDIPSYMKYYIGWVDKVNVDFRAESDANCSTYRIYKSSLIGTYDSGRKYALQIGQNLWLSYEPDNLNDQLVTKGVLAHYINDISPAISQLLDTRPNSILKLPNGVSSGYEPVKDFWDAAMVVGDELFWRNVKVSVLNEGGAGIEKWVDIEVCNCITISGDTDNDGVCNDQDQCEGFDDAIDADGDLIPDLCDACPLDPFNDENNNGICDNIECLSYSHESFNYLEGSAESDLDFVDDWTLSADHDFKISSGSLSFAGVSSSDSKLTVALKPNGNSGGGSKLLDFPIKSNQNFWITCLIKANNRQAGGFWIKPNNIQSIAIGKKWGNELSIDNTASGIVMETSVTHYMVARYKHENSQTTVYLWIDRISDYQESNADAVLSVPAIEIEISNLTIQLEKYGYGEYEIDELRITCDNGFEPIITSIKPGRKEDKELFQFYPNPSSEVIYFTNQGTEQSELKLYNSLGELVLIKEIGVGESVVNVSQFKAGVYFGLFHHQNFKFVKN